MIVEVDPGYRPNSPRGVAQAVGRIADRWGSRYGQCPLFLLENRTGQVISRGADLAEFWEEVLRLDRGLSSWVGVVLDVQQLYTEARTGFRFDLGLLAPEAVKAYHIHTRHSVPSHADPIDWRPAFALVRRSLDCGRVYLLPEVHHRGAVGPTVRFVREFLPTEEVWT